MKFGKLFRMIDSLESIDRNLVVYINGCHNSFFDEFMWFFSGPYIIIPIFIIILWSLLKIYSVRDVGFILFGFVLVIAIADLSSVYCFKEVFMRYRPSHHAQLIEKLHFYESEPGQFYRGGLYGFVSSHAANYFAVCTTALALIKVFWVRYFLCVVTIIIMYSRVYLGVHYVSDLICGAILGYFVAQLILHFIILKKIRAS